MKKVDGARKMKKKKFLRFESPQKKQTISGRLNVFLFLSKTFALINVEQKKTIAQFCSKLLTF
jgi:hypothetical protein